MRAFFILALLIAGCWHCYAQKTIRDKHITNQQERMVLSNGAKTNSHLPVGF